MDNIFNRNDCFYLNGSEVSDDYYRQYSSYMASTFFNITKYAYIILIFLSIISIIVNILFIIFTFIGVNRRAITYRIYYFALNRSICDFIASSAMIIMMFGVSSHLIPFKIAGYIFTFTTLPYFTNFATNIIFAVLKLTAVKWPLIYRIQLTKRRCFYLIICAWIIAGIDQVITTSSSTHIIVQLIATGYILPIIASRNSHSILCDNAENCASSARIIYTFASGFTYLLVLVMYFITAHIVKQSLSNQQLLSSSTTKPKSHIRVCRKLLTSVIVFSLCNVLEAPGWYITIGAYPVYSRVMRGECTILDESEMQLFTQQMIVYVCWCSMLFIRMSVDPIMNVIADKSYKRMLSDMWNSFRKRQPLSSNTTSTNLSPRITAKY